MDKELFERLTESIEHHSKIAYEVELRASIKRGLADSDAGHVVAVEDLMKELGIEE